MKNILPLLVLTFLLVNLTSCEEFFLQEEVDNLCLVVAKDRKANVTLFIEVKKLIEAGEGNKAQLLLDEILKEYKKGFDYYDDAMGLLLSDKGSKEIDKISSEAITAIDDSFKK